MVLPASAHEVMHALDHPPGAFGLFGNAAHGLLHQGQRLPIGLGQQVQRAGGIAGNGRQRLVQFMAEQRGHFAHAGQAGGGLQPLLLLARHVFGAALGRQIQHRAHPAGVAAGAVHQRRLIDDDRKAFARLAQELGLIALARRWLMQVTRQPVGLTALVELGLVGRPVGRRPRRLVERATGLGQLFGAVADHGAERRVDIDDAAVAVACTKTGDQRVFHRLAKGQRLGQGGLGTGTSAGVTHQQHDHHEQAGRQAHDQRGGQVGNQPGRTLGRVHPQLQGAARQIDHPFGDEHAGSTHRATARQARAVGLDEQDFMVAGLLARAYRVQQFNQRDAGHRETHQLPGLLHRDAHVHHLHAQAMGQRHELAVCKTGRTDSTGLAAGLAGIKIGGAARPMVEQRLAKRRVHGVDHLPLPVALFNPAELGVLAQQASRQRTPGAALAAVLLQALQFL